MVSYIEFPGAEGEPPVLVEVDEREVAAADAGEGGFEDVAIFRDGRKTVAVAAASFEEVVRNAVRRNVKALTDALEPLERRPDEIEITFSLKATGEVGNIAIAKVGGEANFAVKLTWKGAGDGSA